MRKQGWIALHRTFLESPIFRDSHAVHLWVHLLLSANHKEGKVLVGNNMMTINRGQLLTGRKALSAATGIQESKIERLLKLFKSNQQIEQQSFSKFRLISITNYDEHQSCEQQVNSKRTASEQQVNTNNNVNNGNKEDKTSCSASKTKYRFEDEDMRLAVLIKNKAIEVVPTLNIANMETWANDIRLARERDGRTRKDLHAVFIWANKDSFWRQNILSPSKLRKQFDVLASKCHKKSSAAHVGLAEKNYEEGLDGFNN